MNESPWQNLWLNLRRSRTAMLALMLLSAMYLGVVFAGFISPYAPNKTNDRFGFHPPMLARIHLFDEGQLFRPFVYGIQITNPTAKGYEGYAEDKSRRYPIRFFVSGDGYRLLGIFRMRLHLVGVDEPGLFYLLGSDQFGRDLLSRILAGSQVSLTIGVVGILLSTLIGVLIGGIAGYFGGKTDFLLMRLVELLLAVPSLYFILILRQSLGDELSSVQLYSLIAMMLSLIGWASQARVVRGLTLGLKEREFVLAARASGASEWRILTRHILPNTFSAVIVPATTSVPFFILSEVALSFLGVGIQEPDASLGNLLAAAQSLRTLTDFTWLLLPGVFLFAATLAWNWLGDGLRDAMDPRA